ncbi:PAS domain-containing sensor histidine kinase [Phenylobacterium sp.]|uniref:PAS domain-containing sensor histidine kinase n=1 Tax=Phenylobacterium sp. TaxID=1871053 RepID=UPI002F959296
MRPRHDFLLGGGEMGERLRAHDWSTSPLGPPEAWPQSLRTSVSILLNSGHPMFVAWGPELGFLYNDAYAVILGDKHPAALGRRFEEIWADIWADILPLVETALSGEATWSEDLLLRMFRHGYWEDTWWTFSYSPVRDESGAVGGMFCACTETTAKVLGERRLKFQLAIAERLRPLTDPRAIKAAAASLLGETLGAGRVGFAEMEADESWLTVEDDWAVGDMAPFLGRFRLEDFGPGLAERLRAGQVLRIDDVQTDPLTAEHAASFAALGIGAVLAMPLVKEGRVVTVLSAHMAAPRAWTDDDQAMAQELVERTWSGVQRARAENRLRENEERLRLVQAAGGVGSFDWDMRTGTIHRSPEYLQLQGLPPDQGEAGSYTDDWLSRVHPEDRDRVWQGFLDDRARTGPFAREYRIVRASDGEVRWIHNRGRIDADPQGRAVRLLSVQTDITDRKRDETRHRLLLNELNHRVKNTLATIQSIAAQTLRNAASLAQAQADFENRLLALSRTHDILTRRTWEGATAAEIAEGAIQPYGPERFRCEGPTVDLPPQTALSIAMALHELGTNAAKYGALSAPGGRVEIGWTAETAGLRLTWRERGGPPVAPPTRRGFGSRLLERGLARELGGGVRLTFDPQGVVCEIFAPLPDDAADG